MLPHVRTPVRRAGAAHYVLLTVVSFGISVSLTRLYLALTNYPQLGGGEFHIAHMLWGGALLFLAALLPLLLSNRWALAVAALLCGSGVGLFIDEVGKFITSNNNYFHPLAAPIIYAVFLLTVLVYIEVRRPPPIRARDELYRVFDALDEVLDRDLDTHEQAALEARLQRIARRTERPDLVPLATALLTLIQQQGVVRPPRPPHWRRRIAWHMSLWETRWLGRRLLKSLLIVGLLGVPILSMFENQIMRLAITTTQQQGFSLAMITAAEISGAGGSGWFLLRLGSVGVAGLLMVIGGALLALGYDHAGLTAGRLGLILALTVVNLFLFYYNQFLTIGTVLIQSLLLLALIYYDRRFVSEQDRPGAVMGRLTEKPAQRSGGSHRISRGGPHPSSGGAPNGCPRWHRGRGLPNRPAPEGRQETVSRATPSHA